MVALVFVEAVPWRALLVWRTNAWCMTGVLTCSAKISFGSLTSPWREPAESKRGASRWSVSLAAAAAFLAVGFLVVVLAFAITRGPRKIEDFFGSFRPSYRSVCQRGPSLSLAWSTDEPARARLSRPARRP